MQALAIDTKVLFWKAEDFIRSFLQNGEVEVVLKSPMLTTNLLNIVAQIADSNNNRDNLSVTIKGQGNNPPAYIKSANDFLKNLSSNCGNFKFIKTNADSSDDFSCIIKLHKGLSGAEERLKIVLVDQTDEKVVSSDMYKFLGHDLYVVHFTDSQRKEKVYQIFMKPLDMDTIVLP